MTLKYFSPGQSRCDFSPQTRGQYLIYTDKSTQAFSDSQCRQACSSENQFTCRSYSFLPEVGFFFERQSSPYYYFSIIFSQTRDGNPDCLLSGDTQESAGGKSLLV